MKRSPSSRPGITPAINSLAMETFWFGIFVVLVVEMAQITPPVGFNLFVLQGLTKREITWIALKALPLFFLMLAAVLATYFVPEVVLWLPRQMQ
jgi:TRAP-type C4-dicarboxylate transport system permease large subunit